MQYLLTLEYVQWSSTAEREPQATCPWLTHHYGTRVSYQIICSLRHRTDPLYANYWACNLIWAAEAYITKQAVLDQTGSVRRYQSLDRFLSQDKGQTFPQIPPCKQVVAYETGFAALTHTGQVYTLGDERYSACLGREASPANPADEPGLVTALQDLPTGPIAKIGAGGYILAALTTGNDLYLWGGHPGRKTVPADITDEPTPIDIEEKDIVDVAVGETHIIVLTTEGDVFVVGENGNGQLGLPSKSGESWSRVELGLKDGRGVVGVQAGARNSFLLVHKGAV